ncbi:hypothetical protein [Legionella sp.]|uniref:hypothetical protein n=1 Tax=Legionella sp. TaxID=459 RepID=UPI003CC42536
MPNFKVTKKNHSDAEKIKHKAIDTFNNHIIHNAAIASNNIRADNFDINAAKEKTDDALVALNTQNSLQSMLAAQMLSIHELQQTTMACANGCNSIELKKYYTNSAIKLSNCFVQQVNILAKLQGVGGQKIVVERVDIHQGGQAIVGNIQGGMGNKEKI